ncbi:MAG: ABC transporter permease [Candidatus Eremiobacterota bacterium]
MKRRGEVWLLYARELRSALREKNIVLYSLLVPALLYPSVLWMIFTAEGFVSGMLEQTPSRVSLVGLPEEHSRLAVELSHDPELTLLQGAYPDAALRSGSVDVIATFTPGSRGELRADLRFDGSKVRSTMARERLQGYLERYRDRRLEEQAADLGVSPARLQILWVLPRNLATENQVGQYLLSVLLPMAMIVVMGMGGLYPAVDSTAGERERHTWETLLTTAASRDNILLAKYLYVVTMICCSGLLNLAALYLCIYAVLEPLPGVTIALPLSSIPILLGGTLLLACFLAAGMMVPAAFARTFQQGQALTTPFYSVTILPTVLVADPSIPFTNWLAFVPVLNAALVFREALAGSIVWPQTLISLGVLVICVALALGLARRVLAYEDVVVGTYGGSFWTFLRQRLLRRREP